MAKLKSNFSFSKMFTVAAHVSFNATRRSGEQPNRELQWAWG